MVIGAWAAAAGLIVLAVVSDPAGRILAGLAAIPLTVEAGRCTLRPVSLRLLPDGVELLTGWRLVRLDWPEVLAARSVRLGHLLPTSALEVETTSRAYLLSQFRLGAPVSSVVAAIAELRAGASA